MTDENERERKLTELGKLLTGDPWKSEAIMNANATGETTQSPGDDVASLHLALTAADRCDQCGAQAVASVFRMHALSIPELLLCGHHLNDHRQALTSKGWTIAS